MLRVGIWGFGGIAAAHRNAYAALEQKGVPAKLTAVCDIREEAFSKEVKINLSAENNSAVSNVYNCYTDIEEMLAEEKLDLIDICLPAYLHAQAVIKVLNKGYHVLCEKPMALNYKDCEKMMEAAQKTDKKLMIGQCLHFQERYAYLKKAVETRKYGNVISGSFHRLSMAPLWGWENWFMNTAKSGGVKMDLHVHDIDMIQYAFGMPKSVSCIVSGKEGLSGIDSVFTAMRYEDGAIIHAAADWSFPQSFKFDFGFRISFEKGVLVQDGKGLFFYDDEKCTEIDCPLKASAIANEIEYFIGTIENHTENTINPLKCSADTILLQEYMKESMENGGKVIEL